MDRPHAPIDTIMIFRELDELKQARRLRAEIKTVDPQEVREVMGNQRVIMGWTQPGQFDEVFPIIKDTTMLARKMRHDTYEFYRVDIALAKEGLRPVSVYLGPSVRSTAATDLEELMKRQINMRSREKALALISRLVHFALDSSSLLTAPPSERPPGVTWGKDSSLLDILVTVGLMYKPGRWLTGAFYALDGGDVLQLAGSTRGYPVNTGSVQVSQDNPPGPIGWVARHKTHLVINHPQPQDLRLPAQFNTNRNRHAFVPAILGTECIGALHVVGSAPANLGEEASFTQEDVEFLYVLGRIIGEAYYRARIAGALSITSILPLSRIDVGDEAALKSYVVKVIEEDILPLSGLSPNSESIPVPRDTYLLKERYLGLFSIDCRSGLSGGAASEYLSLAQERIIECLRQFSQEDWLSGYGRAALFSLTPTQLVVTARNLREEQVLAIREALQKYLDEISTINTGMQGQSAVWSVHLPYSYFLESLGVGEMYDSSSLNEVRLETIAQEAIDRVHEALRVVWQVKPADAYLKQRNFDEALALLHQALSLDETNSYVLRHIAQAWLAKGEYDKARKAANQAVQIDESKHRFFASSYLRLAESLFLLGERQEAFETMEKASAVSGDPRYKIRWAELLILDGTNENLGKALRILVDLSTRSQIDTAKRLAWVEKLRAEANFKLNKKDEALSALDRASKLDPTNTSISWEIARIRASQPVDIVSVE
jgi:tetratricopeptide (TPR) repeat protein